MPKCQKRTGKKCIKYRGVNKYYKNPTDLASQLDIPVIQAKKYIKEQSKIIIDEDGKVEKVDLKKNPLPLLQREFGIKRISNKKLTTNKQAEIKNVTITNELGGNVFVQVILVVQIKASWHTNGDTEIKYIDEEFVYNGYVDEIRKFIEDQITNRMDRIGAKIESYEYKIVTTRNRKELEWVNNKLRSNYVYDLTEYCNIMYSTQNNGNCVKKLLKEKYPRISSKSINSLGNKQGVSISEIIHFCNDYEIKCYIYDVLGNLKYESIKYENKQYATLSFIAYNNHIYPLSTKKPKRKNKNNIEIVIVNNCLDKIKKLVDKKIIPSDVSINKVKNDPKELADINVISYIYNGKKYIANNEYTECSNILKLFNLENNIYDSIKIGNIFSEIEKKFISFNIESFLPEQDMFNKGGFIYKTKNINAEREISTIDKNKAYTYSLYTLPYLIVCDWRLSEITKNPIKIIDQYLYIAKPEKSTILLPNTNLYAGYYLKECKKNGINFLLLEELSTTIVPNNYKIMIDKSLKILSKVYSINDTWKIIKDGINILVGKMERSMSIHNKYIYNGILNNNENKTIDGYQIKIDNDHQINYTVEHNVNNLYNRKPIAIQVKDNCRLIVFKKMKELGLTDDDIVQIKTDSISYYGKLPSDLSNNDFYGWKKEEFKEIDSRDIKDILDNNDLTFNIVPITTKSGITKNISKNQIIEFETEHLTRELHSCYAGVGKTTFIINELIPKLQEKNIKFRVMTPSHISGEEYKKLNVPFDVIQKFTLHNKIPDEDYIIIDEIGFVDKQGHDLLCKLCFLGKSYSALGDFGQQLPVGEDKEYFTKHYNDYLYNDQPTSLNINHRNNIPFEYYEKLKQNKIDVKHAVHQYSTKKYHQAEFILCFFNSTKDYYNRKMLEKLKINKYTKGVPYICNTNKLLDRDISNGMLGFLKKKYKKDGIIYYCLEMNNNIFTVDKYELDHYFELGYALNSYEVQGKTIKSFYWAREDDCKLEDKNNGRLAYTIISRLSGDVYISE